MEGTASQLGESVRDQFLLEKGTVFCNHGSYGTVPRIVLQERIRLLEQMESNPDRWFRSELRVLYDANIEALAKFVGSDPNNIVFVNNATVAVNTVMKNLILEREDIILLNSHTYRACAKTIECTVNRTGADTISLDITLPIRSEDRLVEEMVEVCKRNVGVRLVIIDHISSPSAIIFPVQRIIRELHKLGVLVLVDGAHAPGQLDLNLEELGADFYTGNLHKWCYAPRGSAFLWVHPKHQSGIQPLITSHNYLEDFRDQFFFQGTADHTTYLCTKASLDFYRWCGGMSAIKKHTEQLLDWAQQMLCQALGTSVLPIPRASQAPYMRVLKLPALKDYSVCQEDAERAMTEVNVKYNCVTVFVFFSGSLWLRISANVYNTREDYIALKDILLKLVK